MLALARGGGRFNTAFAGIRRLAPMKGRLIAVAIAAGMLALGVAPAAQASGEIIVISAGSQPQTAGLLTVMIESSTPVVPSSISASMFATGASSPALTVSDFVLTSGNNTGGTTTTWQVSSPITQEQLALGTYTVEVQASDTGGDTTNDTDAGTLALLVYPTVQLTVSPTSFSYGEDVTLSGTDTGLYPDGTTAPVAGQEIYGYGGQAATNSAGQFSFTVQAGIGDADTLYGSVGVGGEANPTTTTGGSNLVPVSVILAPLRVTLAPVKSPLTWPEGAAFTGTVSYEIGTSWLPFPNFNDLKGYVYGTQGVGYGWLAAGSVTAANSSGDFTASYGAGNTTRYTVRPELSFFLVNWFTPVAESVEVPVNHVETLFDYFTRTPESSGRIKFNGCIEDARRYGRMFIDPSELKPFPVAQFQYSAKKTGPWRSVSGASKVKATRTVTTRYIRACYQSATVKKPSGANWYRFLVPANTAWLGTQSGPQRA
jgi:hypothetical protein